MNTTGFLIKWTVPPFRVLTKIKTGNIIAKEGKIVPYKLKGNTVVKSKTGKPVKGGKHQDHAKALAHLRALEINVEDTGRVKRKKRKK